MEFDGIFKSIDNKDINMTTATNGNIEYLYNLINDYVERNYLSTYDWDNYYIQYNDKYYLVGCFHGPEIVYYVRRASYMDNIDYLNFNNILNNIITPKEEDIKNRIDILKNEIKSLQGEGVKTTTLKRALRI